MWQRENDYEESMASYWEERDDFDARELATRRLTRGKRIYSLQSKAAELLKRIHGGLSAHPDRTHRQSS